MPSATLRSTRAPAFAYPGHLLPGRGVRQCDLSCHPTVRKCRTASFRRPRAAVSAPAQEPEPPAEDARLIPGTPCFTRSITATPMPVADRKAYVRAAADAALRFVQDDAAPRPRVASLTLLLPQLNPELDVFDRRFVLLLAWTVVNALCFEARLRTRVLVQGVGRYGAVPLSVAGLRKTFEADMRVSAELWGGEEAMSDVLRVGDLEDPDAVGGDDDAFVVITPGNATGMPVITDVMRLVERVGDDRPVILINPRLSDIPSSAGVMGVSGRAERNVFRDSLNHLFYLRLLYSTGSQYPLRGILYHSYSEPWQVWCPEDGLEGTPSFRLVAEYDSMPSSSIITDALSIDRRNKRAKKLDAAPASLDSLLGTNVPLALVAGTSLVTGGLYYLYTMGILP